MARPATLARLGAEIAAARAHNPALRLVIGHGSGSFGHVSAQKHRTRQGVHSPENWLGFVEVWRDANALHRLVLDALSAAGLPVISFPPSAMTIAADGQVAAWNLEPLCAALSHGIIPLIQGDTIFDTVRGGTILSTEDLFVYLARQLQPEKIFLAGIEPGVWLDFPACQQLFPAITPANFTRASLAGASATDVTGGMQSKVRAMLSLVEENPALRGYIFSGETPGAVRRALCGDPVGTIIHAV